MPAAVVASPRPWVTPPLIVAPGPSQRLIDASADDYPTSVDDKARRVPLEVNHNRRPIKARETPLLRRPRPPLPDPATEENGTVPKPSAAPAASRWPVPTIASRPPRAQLSKSTPTPPRSQYPSRVRRIPPAPREPGTHQLPPDPPQLSPSATTTPDRS
jgi:hypothetical protein